MDTASASGAEDSGFESQVGHSLTLIHSKPLRLTVDVAERLRRRAANLFPYGSARSNRVIHDVSSYCHLTVCAEANVYKGLHKVQLLAAHVSTNSEGLLQ